MVIRRTTLAVLSTCVVLVALFVGSCKDSESPSSPTAPGTATVMGTVVSGDAGTAGRALSGVTVRAQSGQATVTDAGGNFMLPGVSSGSQSFQFSRGDIDGKGTIAVVGGTTMAVDVRISNRSTIVITPRGNPNAPAQTETVTATVTGTPPTSTSTPTVTATSTTPVVSTTATPTPAGGGCNKEEQIEGIVLSNSGGVLTIFDQRLGTVMVTVSPTTTIRKGQTPMTLADILVGWRVHVKACLQSTGTYLASEIIVQNTNEGVTNTPVAATNTPTVTNTATLTPTKTNTPTTTRTATPTVTGTPPTSTPTIIIPTVGAPR